MKPCLILAGIIGIVVRCASSPFQDLNFDSANTNNLIDVSGGGDYYGPIGDLLPGWQLVTQGFGTNPNTGFNLSLGGLGYHTVESPNNPNAYPVVGGYSFAMLPDYGPVSGTFVPYSLSQAGDLPTDVRSIHFISYGSPVQLTANGLLVSLSYTPMVSQPGWDPSIPVFEAEGDLSAFAGQNVDLTFTTVLPPNYQGQYVLNGLDEISFSTVPVPEPSTYALLGLGGLALHSLRFGKRAKVTTSVSARLLGP